MRSISPSNLTQSFVSNDNNAHSLIMYEAICPRVLLTNDHHRTIPVSMHVLKIKLATSEITKRVQQKIILKLSEN